MSFFPDYNRSSVEQEPAQLGSTSSERTSVRLEVIGEGSFGRVYAYPGAPHAYKVCIYPDGGETLLHEAKIYDELRVFTTDDNAWSFICPKVPRLFKPTAAQQLEPICDPTPDLSKSIFPHPTLQIDRVLALPDTVVHLYREFFISAEARPRAPRIRLLRLYLGREFPLQTTDFRQGLTSDLPLDAKRYARIREILPGMAPPIEHIAFGMGQLLARMHWGVGIDARDVELVLGGRMIGGRLLLQCWVLDFNQCHRWLVYRPLEYLRWNQLTQGEYVNDDLPSGARRLARIISGQELYYPRPHQTELYQPFKDAYMTEVVNLVDRAIMCDGPDLFKRENRAGAKNWRPQIILAAYTFFNEYEALDAEKCRRQAQRAAQDRMARVGEQWRALERR